MTASKAASFTVELTRVKMAEAAVVAALLVDMNFVASGTGGRMRRGGGAHVEGAPKFELLTKFGLCLLQMDERE